MSDPQYIQDTWWIDGVPTEIVRCAVKIIGPAIRQRSACKEDVERALENLKFVRAFAVRRTKRGKIAARRLASALRRVDVALRNDDLFPGLTRYLPHFKLLLWIKECEATARRPPNSDGTEWRGSFEKRAAEEAYKLPRKHGRPVSTTKGSKFEQLAAALAGDPNAKFHHYCRAVVRSAEMGSE